MMTEREPICALADITVHTADQPPSTAVEQIVETLHNYLLQQASTSSMEFAEGDASAPVA